VQVIADSALEEIYKNTVQFFITAITSLFQLLSLLTINPE